jgi:hypothetical protein
LSGQRDSHLYIYFSYIHHPLFLSSHTGPTRHSLPLSSLPAPLIPAPTGEPSSGRSPLPRRIREPPMRGSTRRRAEVGTVEELPQRPNPARSKVLAPPLRLFLCSGCLPPHTGSPALGPEAGGRGGVRTPGRRHTGPATAAVGSRASSRTAAHGPDAGGAA